MISGDSSETFEVVCVLVDFGPLQTEGFQLCPSALLALRVLILVCELGEELFPDCWDIVDLLEGVNPFSHGSCPLGDEWSLDKREGEGNPLDVRSHAGHLAIESDVCLQLIDEVVGVHSISGEDGG